MIMTKKLSFEWLSHEAFVEEIYKRHHEQLLACAIGFCKDSKVGHFTADDVMQEFYKRVWEKIDLVRAGYTGGDKGYLYSMVYRAFVNLIRKKEIDYTRLEEIQPEPVASSSDFPLPSEELERQDLLNQIELALKDRNEDLQIFNFHLAGYSYDEIGELLNMCPSTVGVRLNRLKKYLRKILE